MHIAAPASPRVLTLLAQVDATAKELEPDEVAEVEAFERSCRPDVAMRVQLSRSAGPSPGAQVTRGLLEMATVPAVFALAPSLGLLALPAIGGAYYMMYRGAQHLATGLRSLRKHHEPVWTGSRTYDIQPDRTKGRLDSPIVAQSEKTRPNRLELSTFLAEGMRAYPAQVTAFLASGHGLAYEGCTGYKIETLRKALTDAAVLSGRKLDVIVLEACLMGNVEALDRLKDTARYAIVSQETMGASGLPWKEILGSLPSGQMSPQLFGHKVVEAACDTRAIDTIALVDLTKMGALTQSVNALAVELRRVVADGNRAEVRAALGEAELFPRPLIPIGRPSFDVRDLGQIADNVLADIHDEGARKAADNVHRALTDAVVAFSSKPKYGTAQHMSIQGPLKTLDTEAYAKKTGFTEWAALLSDLRGKR